MNRFERDLERDLHGLLDPVTASQVPPRRRTRRAMVRGFWGAPFAARALSAVAILVVAAAASEAVVAQSLNPVDWSRQVGQQLHISPAKRVTTAPRTGPTKSTQTGGGVVQSPSPRPVLPGGVVVPPVTPLPSPPALPTVKATCLPLNVIAGRC
jgi:hypothetical protein